MKVVIVIRKSNTWPFNVSNKITVTNQNDISFPYIIRELEKILKNLKKQITQDTKKGEWENGQ